MTGTPTLSWSAERRTGRRVTLILFVWAVIYLPGLFRPALLDDADSVNAEVGREILARHDWVTTYANGIRYVEKPPLLFWALAASYRLFGVAEWSARLPVALSGLILVLLTFRVGRRAFGEEAGFYAALIQATALGPFLLTRILYPDAFIGLWLALGVALFLCALEQEQPSRAVCWGVAAAAALNVLTKGLIGVIFPVAIIGLYVLLTGNLAWLKKLRLASSAAVFLLIAAPWHILVALRNPDQPAVRGFLWFYFVNEHILRYLNQRVPHDYVTVPFLLFWGLILVWLVPWVAFLPSAIARVPIRLSRLRQHLSAEEKARLVFALWALVVPGFFTFSTRQEYYTLPALAAFALLLGDALAQESCAEAVSRIRHQGRMASAVLLAIGIAAFLVVALLAAVAKPPPAGADIAALLAKHPEQYIFAFGRFLDLTPQALGAFRGLLWLTGATLLLGTAANWWFRKRGDTLRGNLALAAMMVALLNFCQQGLIAFEPVLSSRALARAIQREYRPGEVIAIQGDYEGGSTLNFYTGVQVHILNGRRANLWYGSLYADAPPIFEDDTSFLKLWRSSTRVYLWTEEDQRPRGLPAEGTYEIAHAGGKIILSNRPAKFPG